MPRSSPAFVVSFILVALILLEGGCSLKEKNMDEPLIARAQRERYVAPPPEEYSAEGDQLGAAYFPTDSAELTDAAKEVLREDARWLRSHPDASIQVEGYCDIRGSHEYNLPLGQQRADAAKRFLIAQGVAAGRVSAISYGRVDEARPSQWPNNRRASFLIFYAGSPATQAQR